MPEPTSTIQQIILLVLFVLPGIVYQFVRERMRGPAPGERDLGERVLRAITASIALDALYLILAGPQLVRLITPTKHLMFGSAIAAPRAAAALALLLFIVIPALAALVMTQIERRRHPSRFDPTPTAWDSLFRGRRTGFVRARLKSGVWVGGWYGKRSSASSYPNASDLYLEAAYQMDGDGGFGARVPDTGGLYLRMDDTEVLEFLEARHNDTDGGDAAERGKGADGRRGTNRAKAGLAQETSKS